MENPVKDAFIDQESIKARSNATSASGATQSGFEILVEPGFSGEAESNVFNIAVKYINDKYLSIETEYNRTEKALLDKFTESTFGKGRNRDP